jgi:hypothetical protein
MADSGGEAGEPVEPDTRLLRRIHPKQVIKDENKGGELRPSSAAFKDAEMSVDVEEVLHRRGLDWHFSLRDYPDYSLTRLPTAHALSLGLDVTLRPLPNNPAHAVIGGKKTQGIANRLRDASEWVHLVNPADTSS